MDWFKKRKHKTTPFADAIKKMLDAGGNIKYIAQNIATIYYCIAEEDDVFDRFSRDREERNDCFVLFRQMSFEEKQEEDRLSQFYKLVSIAAAIIDLFPYISEGSVDIDDLVELGRFARCNLIGPSDSPVCTTRRIFDEKYAYLKSVIMQTEYLIFRADVPFAPQIIIHSIHENKYWIFEMCEDTIARGKRGPLYDSIKPKVEMLLQNKDFIDLVLDVHYRIENYGA